MTNMAQTDDIRRDIEDGNLIQAYDQLSVRLNAGNKDKDTCYLYVLTLARMGLTDRALEAYEKHDLADAKSTEALSIYPRLLKDRALAKTGPDRQSALRVAAETYHEVYQKSGSFFPAINAASLYALAGQSTRARDIAQTIISAEMPQPPQYYDLATVAEAQAILGRLPHITTALQDACARPGAGTGARAVTARQIGLILDHQGVDADQRAKVLSPLSAGRAVCFSSVSSCTDDASEARLRTQVRKFLQSKPVAAAFGTLTSEVEIIVAEEVLAANVPCFLFLAAPVEDTARTLVGTGRADLFDRLQKCLDASTDLHVVNDSFHGDHPLGDALTRRLAWGNALAYGARNLCPPHRLVINAPGADAKAVHQPDPTVTTLGIKGLVGAEQHSPQAQTEDQHLTRREVSMLFADLAGFSALPDSMLPQFIERASGAFAQVLEENGDTHLFCNTWGDAFFAVFAKTEDAVRVSQKLLDRLERDEMSELLKGLRISLHHGLAMEIFDPVLRRANFFGREVSRAARIEPVTPPGCIYASEAFVYADTSAGARSASFEYVGRVELPKQFGAERLYLVI